MIKLSYIEKLEFINKHSGKEIRFLYYHKDWFYYEFTDESGVKYKVACVNDDGNAYRDHWSSVEKIGENDLLSCFIHYICVDEVNK